MNVSNARATFGLNAKVTPAKAGSNGTLQVGDNNETINLTSATKIISFDAVIVGTTSDLVIDVSDLDNTGSTAWTSGVAQVETNTIVAAGGCTSNGTMTLVVTSASVTGSPKNVAVALTTTAHTTAALIATAARTALAADSAVAAVFTIGGTGADITLTRKPTSTYTVNGTSIPVYPANDATANLAIPGGLGVTADSTSTDTTAGVATAGTYCPDLDGNDFEGESTGGLSSVNSIYMKVDDESTVNAIVNSASTEIFNLLIHPGSIFSNGGTTAITHGDYTITANNEGDQSLLITVTIVGS